MPLLNCKRSLAMIFKRMREQILDKAIRGQLVPQLAEDGVVDQIGEAPAEVPFEIPRSWKWCKLESISSIVRGSSPRPIKDFLTNSDDGINWIKIGDSERGSKHISKCAEKITYDGSLKSRFVKRGSLLLTNSMSYGYPYILNVDGCIHDGWLSLSDFDNFINKEFLYYMLLSNYCRSVFVNKASGAVVKNLNIDKVKSVYIPLPPITEQKRIASKIESLFGEIDCAEKAYEELQSLANVLKGQILQKAIQGKLVPQLPEDGVVEQIGDAPEEAPFDIPNSWKWLSFSDLLIFENGDRGKNYPAKSKLSKDASSGLPFVSAGNISNGRINSKDLLFLSKEQEAKLKSGHIKANDCLMCIRGSLGKFGFAEKDGGAIASSLVILRIKEQSFLDKDFLSIVLSSPLFSDSLLARKNGTAQPNLGADVLKKFPFPLPPLAEQKRIVAKVEALFEQIDLMTK